MAVAAPYAPPLRASMVPLTLKRTMTAKSVYAAVAPSDSPVIPSIAAPLGVASNCTVKDPVWAVNAVFSHAGELALHPGGGGAGGTVLTDVALRPSQEA